MSSRPSVNEFATYQVVRRLVDEKDVHLMTTEQMNRQDRRMFSKIIGGSVRKREDPEIVEQLTALGENATSDQIDEVMTGLFGRAKKKFDRYMAGGGTHAGLGPHTGYQPSSNEKLLRGGVDLTKINNGKLSVNQVVSQMVKWFAGKRYGIVVEEDLAAALMESEIDLGGFPINLPWSPMLVKGPFSEYFMWERDGEAVYREVRFNEGEPEVYNETFKVCENKDSLVAWLVTVARGEESHGTFDLKIGDYLVAVLPSINSDAIRTKHRITQEATTDKGSWVRKGHFRNTRSGMVWVDGAHYKADQPFVLKQHDIERKAFTGGGQA